MMTKENILGAFVLFTATAVFHVCWPFSCWRFSVVEEPK